MIATTAPTAENPPTLTLVLAQLAGRGSVAANEQAMRDAARAAGGGSAHAPDLIVYPEGYLTGYYTDDPVAAALEAAQAEDMIGGIATQAQAAIAAGYVGKNDDGLYNAAIVADKHGRVIGDYKKRCLYGEWERRYFRPGKTPCVFALGDWMLGLCICYDIEFPEISRQTAMRGAELIIVPTALMAPDEDLVFALLPARAIENNVFVAYANRIGGEGEWRYVGGSRIIDPHGATRACADAKTETGVRAAITKNTVAPACDYLRDVARMGGAA